MTETIRKSMLGKSKAGIMLNIILIKCGNSKEYLEVCSLDFGTLKIVLLNFCNFFIFWVCEGLRGRIVMRHFTFFAGGCYLNSMGDFY